MSETPQHEAVPEARGRRARDGTQTPGVFTDRQVAFLGLIEAAPLAVGFAIGMNAGSPLAGGLAVAVGLALAGAVARVTRLRAP